MRIFQTKIFQEQLNLEFCLYIVKNREKKKSIIVFMKNIFDSDSFDL